jgi:hypothetical protein
MATDAPRRKSIFSREAPTHRALPTQKVASVKASEVFTPSVPAERGFVGRTVEMRDLRQKGLNVPGTQIAIWGESGAGKSSLVKKVLEDNGRTAVKTACTPDSTYEHILEAAFSGTGAFYISEKSNHTDVTLEIKGSVGSELIGAKVSSSAALDTGENVTLQPISKPQLNPQTLLRELGVRNLSWVIEDFHKVSPKTRTAIAHALKVFSDDGLKYPDTTVIVLGVSESVDELVDPEVNLGKRLIDIGVPPLDHAELGKILNIGQQLLNVDFSLIRERLLNTSVGVASVTHALALNCCDEQEFVQAGQDTVTFTEENFDAAVEAYARTRSGDLKSRFRKALMVHRQRKFANTEIILRVLTQLPEEGGTVGEIYQKIRAEHSSYPQANLTNYLRDLQGEARGSLVRKTNANRYRFDEPLQQADANALFGLTGPSEERSDQHSDAWVSALNDLLNRSTYSRLLEGMLDVADYADTPDDSDDEGEDNSWMDLKKL